ncbi:redox-sensing transcriptional repressor Rex [Peptoniphilus sp. GNH]|nr:redox-sensing transcriptional repressor Rex [Peptoniphilus sp. GNH]
MKHPRNVSETVIRRLPIYYRYLQEEMEMGQVRISSKELSEKTGFTASQIRQDLNNFGGFGQQGYGYNVGLLKDEIAKIIGIDKTRKAIIVGAGSLGYAIARYQGFKNSGLEIRAMFDVDTEKIGKKVENIEVKDMKDLVSYVRRHKIEVGIITTPGAFAQEITDALIKLGVKGIWNFTPVDLDVEDDVVVENVRLNDSLLTLFYYLNHPL